MNQIDRKLKWRIRNEITTQIPQLLYMACNTQQILQLQDRLSLDVVGEIQKIAYQNYWKIIAMTYLHETVIAHAKGRILSLFNTTSLKCRLLILLSSSVIDNPLNYFKEQIYKQIDDKDPMIRYEVAKILLKQASHDAQAANALATLVKDKSATVRQLFISSDKILLVHAKELSPIKDFESMVKNVSEMDHKIREDAALQKVTPSIVDNLDPVELHNGAKL